MLLSVLLKNEAPLPVLLHWLLEAKPFPSQSIQRFHMNCLVISLDGLAAGVLGWADLVPGSADEGSEARFTGRGLTPESVVMGLGSGSVG